MSKFISFILGAASMFAVLKLKNKKKEEVYIPEEVRNEGAEEAPSFMEFAEVEDIKPSKTEEVDYTKDYTVENLDETEVTRFKPDLLEMVNNIVNEDADDENEEDEDEEEEDGFHIVYGEDVPKDPYLITAQDYGNDDEGFGYLTDQLTYYSSGKLCEFDGTPIDNPVEVIGQEALSRLVNCDSIYSDDAVMWVRNDKFRTDYEISWEADN